LSERFEKKPMFRERASAADQNQKAEMLTSRLAKPAAC
jgi:hypothetical protein